MTATDFLTSAAYQLVPRGLRESDGKLSPENCEEFARFHPLEEAIASAEPYERDHPGCDNHWYDRLVNAQRRGYTILLGVWDCGFAMVLNDAGTGEVLNLR